MDNPETQRNGQPRDAEKWTTQRRREMDNTETQATLATIHRMNKHTHSSTQGTLDTHTHTHTHTETDTQTHRHTHTHTRLATRIPSKPQLH